LRKKEPLFRDTLSEVSRYHRPRKLHEAYRWTVIIKVHCKAT